MINKDLYLQLKNELESNKVELIAVSKRQPIEKLKQLYELGHRVFGENHAQAVKERNESLNSLQIDWHFIGHLQTNKIKYIAPFVSMIHSVDSFKLLTEINKYALKNDRTINCLLQMYIAEEESKFGLDFDEVLELLDSKEFNELENIQICGVMGMATYTENENQIRKEFKQLHNHFEKIKAKYFNQDQNFKEISMGMSGDYKIAVEEGSTMVRIGTMIFGERTY